MKYFAGHCVEVQPAAHNQWEPHEPQDVAEQDEQLDDDVVPILPPNMDINLSVFFDLHSGQDTASCSLLDLNKISKILLHFLHLNSYIGIYPSFFLFH